MSKNNKRKLVTLTKEDWDWMIRHPEIKASVLLHNAIDDYKKKLVEV